MSHSLHALRAVATAAGCACVVSLPVLAQSSEAVDPGSTTVVVSASRSVQTLAEALPHTTVIDRAQIERLQAVDLVSLLTTEAGVQVASNGGRGTASALFVRGAPTRQVLVLVDGVPLLRQDATGQLGLEHLMLDQVERVEIVRGNVSALYGSGAVGGVIQVFTRGASGSGVRGLVEGGSRGLAHAAAGLSGQSGATAWSVGLSDQRDGGYSAIDPARVAAANPDRDGYRNQSATLGLTHTAAPGQVLGLSLWHTEGRLDYDSSFATPADTQRSNTRKSVARVWADNALGERWTSRLSLSTQRDDARYDESGSYGYVGRYVTRVESLRWANDVVIDAGWRLVAGLEQERQHIDADDGFGGTYQRARSVRAVFAGMHVRGLSQQLALDLRRDHLDGTGSRTSARAGWSWVPQPAWTVFASAATAFSAPPLGYLYAPWFGNPALRPEVSTSAEAGLQWQQARQRVRATAFHTRVRDELDYDLSTYRFDNLARTRNRGLEVSADGRWGGLDWRASATSQRPVDAVSGQPRLRRSEQMGALTLSQQVAPGWRAGAALKWSGARPEVGGAVLPAYVVADLTTQWDVSASWQVFARIENLGDVRYETAAGYPQPRRGVFVGLRWRTAP